MKRLSLVLIFCLSLAGVSSGQGRSRDRSSPAVREARDAAIAAGSRALEARTREREAWSQAEKNSASAAAEKNAREASRAAREAGKAAHEAGARYDRAVRESRGRHD